MGRKRSQLISGRGLFFEVLEPDAREPLRQTIEPQVNDWRGVKRQQLAHQQAADYGDSQRMTEF
jgi:hypothetical protein